MTDDRDHELGAALRGLDVPEHGPGFWDAVAADVRLEREAGGGAPHGRGGARRQRRRFGPAAHRARSGRTLATLAVAALVAVALGAGVLVAGDDPATVEVAGPSTETTAPPTTSQDPGSTTSTPAPAPAAAGLEATVEVTLDDGSVRTFDVLASRDGSRSVSDVDSGARVVRDATTGTVVEVLGEDAGAGGPTAFRTRGLPPGGPEAFFLDPAGEASIADHVLALADASDPRVEQTTALGRPALRLVTDVEPNKLAGGGPDRIEAVVDAETGTLLLLVETAGGDLFRRIEVTTMTTSEAAPPADAFTVDGDAELFDEGYRQVALEDVAGLVGDAGLVAEQVPPGYELAAVAVAPGEGGPSGPEGSNPATVDAVVVTYRDGWRRLVVTSRRTGGDPTGWDDPFRGEGQVLAAEEATVEGGALDGTEVQVVVDPATEPHLWGVHPDLVATVSGPLAPERLLAVATGLRRTG